MEREVAILTMSSKHGGYCVAGIDIRNGKWIRLVSDDTATHGALNRADIRYQNGMCCTPLDVVKVSVVKDVPLEYQPENVLINSKEWWSKIKTLTIDDVLKIHPAEHHTYLLGNQYPYITEARVGSVGHSLVLVKVSNLTLTHPSPTSTKAKFMYGPTEYENISVTDPDFYAIPDLWHVNKAVLVISLPEAPYNENRYYKFVAKIFPILH